MKNKNYKQKNTTIMMCLLALAVCAIFAGTTYAFLSAQLTGNDGLINTFVSSSGLIDPTVPTGESEDYNFNLKESKVKMNSTNNAYIADPDANPQYTKTNTYENVTPGMSIYKDPMLSVNIKDQASVYVYVEIVDNSNNFIYQPDDAWTVLKDGSNNNVVGAQNGTVYVYNSGNPVVGTSSYDIANAHIIKNDTITAKDNLTTTGNNQLGTINIYAYVGQSSGFVGAWEAYNNLFKNN